VVGIGRGQRRQVERGVLAAGGVGLEVAGGRPETPGLYLPRVAELVVERAVLLAGDHQVADRRPVSSRVRSGRRGPPQGRAEHRGARPPEERPTRETVHGREPTTRRTEASSRQNCGQSPARTIEVGHRRTVSAPAGRRHGGVPDSAAGAGNASACASDNDHHKFSVDQNPYADNDIDHIKVQLETQNSDGSWSVLDYTTADIAP
jgi:hypothetical protein